MKYKKIIILALVWTSLVIIWVYALCLWVL